MSYNMAGAMLFLSLLGIDKPFPKLDLLTENNPPYSQYDPEKDEFTGLNVDIAVELMQRAGMPYQLKSMPLNRAYREAVEHPNSCVIGLIFTEERENDFAWVKPTATGGWGLYKRKGSPITLTRVADALPYSIAGAPNYASTESFKAGGYNIVETGFGNALRLLDVGRVDLAIGGLRVIKATARHEGVPEPELALIVKWVEAGLACNPAIDAAVLKHLNLTVKGMQDYIEKAVEATNQPR